MVLAIAAEMDWEVRQLDVKTTFLCADIEEDVFVADINILFRFVFSLRVSESIFV